MEEFDAPVLHRHDETMPPIEPGLFGFSRRSLLVGGGAMAKAAFLAACSSDSKSSTTTGAPGSAAAPGTTAASTSTTAGSAGTNAANGSTTTAGSAPATAGAARTEAKTETITIGVPSLQEAFVDPHWAVGGLIFPLLWAISEPLYTPNQDNKYVPNLAT